MPSFTSLAAALAFVATVVHAQDPNFDSINTPLRDAQVPAGQPFTISWSLLSATTPTGPATITLIGGNAQKNLSAIAIIGHVQNEDLKFVWNVDASLGAEPVYGLNLTLDADTSHFQYSEPFQIVGGAASGSATASASTSTSATGTGSTSGTAATTSTTGATTSASSTTGGSGDGTTTSAHTAPTTTAAAPTHASNSTSNSTSPTSAANKTTAATKPTTTSGATGLSGLSAVGALAVALVASAAMHWGL